METTKEQISEQQPPKKKYQCRYDGAVRYYKNNIEKCKEYHKQLYNEKKQDENWKKENNERARLNQLKRRQQKRQEIINQTGQEPRRGRPKRIPNE
jgi:hypothetical protein